MFKTTPILLYGYVMFMDRSAEVIMGSSADVIMGSSADVIMGSSADVIMGSSADVIMGNSTDVILRDNVKREEMEEDVALPYARHSRERKCCHILQHQNSLRDPTFISLGTMHY